jgi:hypothetical protein
MEELDDAPDAAERFEAGNLFPGQRSFSGIQPRDTKQKR